MTTYLAEPQLCADDLWRVVRYDHNGVVKRRTVIAVDLLKTQAEGLAAQENAWK